MRKIQEKIRLGRGSARQSAFRGVYAGKKGKKLGGERRVIRYYDRLIAGGSLVWREWSSRGSIGAKCEYFSFDGGGGSGDAKKTDPKGRGRKVLALRKRKNKRSRCGRKGEKEETSKSNAANHVIAEI